MAKLVVEIISKDMIRPSSPTRNHLKTLQLSFQDQISPSVHTPLLFFYRSYGANYSETTTLLKESLSRTLVQFYPFAGRVCDLWIDCNDEGVAFYEANVAASVVQVMGDPNNPEELSSLLPFLPFNTNSASKRIVAGIQVNRFSCGGVAIGFSISHKIADATTYVAFVKAWEKQARGDFDNDNAAQIKFVGTSLFPQMSLDGIEPPKDDILKEKIVTKRLIFNKERLDMLRRQCVGRIQVQGKSPTRVEVVSAFFWKQFIKAARAKPTPVKIFAAVQVVNLRTIKSSPVPKNSYGNIYTLTSAPAQVGTEMEYPEAVERLRDAVKQIDMSYYIEKMQTGECALESKNALEVLSQEDGDYCFFSDLSKFPAYEVDFGWGTPIWVSMTSLPFKNMVCFWRTKCGEGMEVLVNVLEQDVAALEQDDEFLSLTPPNILAKL